MYIKNIFKNYSKIISKFNYIKMNITLLKKFEFTIRTKN